MGSSIKIVSHNFNFISYMFYIISKIEYARFTSVLWSGTVRFDFFRILWGFVGTYYSKFKSFNLSVIDGLSQFSKANSISSVRTPIGSYSSLIFIIALLSISVSGLFSSDDVLYDAPLAFLTLDYTSYFTYIHNILHYLLYSLIIIHILAIMYYQIFKKMKIIERVLDGYSRIEKTDLVSINEKPLIGVLSLLILTFLPVLILIYFN